MSQCQGCGKKWGGASACHCSVCHETFSGYSAANLHWGTGRSRMAPGYDAEHLDPRDVPALARDARGVWRSAAKRPVGLQGATQEARNG